MSPPGLKRCEVIDDCSPFSSLSLALRFDRKAKPGLEMCLALSASTATAPANPLLPACPSCRAHLLSSDTPNVLRTFPSKLSTLVEVS